MHSMVGSAASSITAARTESEMKYARKPWLKCDYCGRNTWRKIRRGGGRRNYCNDACAQAAHEARKKEKMPIYLAAAKERRRARKLSTC